jgi:hypothetical protein
MLNGKGMYIWQVARTEGGDPATIADLALAARFTHVIIKIADGTSSYNLSSTGADLVAPLANALKARGIEPWGWHYVYGDNPSGEASKAAQRIRETGVVGYVIDAESEYKQPGKAQAATTFMNALRNALPFFPVGLSSYRYPSLHPELPWQEFLSRCDYALPQVYWVQAHDPANQLTRCLNEYRAMTTLPIIPTGAAFSEGNWAPTTTDIVQFLDAARVNNLTGANFWEWYPARQLPGIWNTIAGYDWPVASPPPVPPGFAVRGRVNTPSLNVRSGPGTEFPTVGVLKEGTRVTIFNLHRGWVKISPDQERWVYSIYLDRLV